ncbi:MAG: hypothetical protein J0H42_04345 [Rhizobiales bacterium]|nr:hypothetical protein [Hyphomicrobiales bacterium]
MTPAKFLDAESLSTPRGIRFGGFFGLWIACGRVWETHFAPLPQALSRMSQGFAMSAGGSGGAGDRGGLVALAAGDRPVSAPEQARESAPLANGTKKNGRIRRARADLLGLDLQRVARVELVVDDQVPAVLMFGGDPFLISGADDRQPLTYLQVRPYRVDALVTDEVRDGR